MTEVEDWHTRRRRYDAFTETELGKLFHTYETALVAYWRIDGDEKISDQRLMELDNVAKTATHNFITKLMELAGV